MHSQIYFKHEKIIHAQKDNVLIVSCFHSRTPCILAYNHLLTTIDKSAKKNFNIELDNIPIDPQDPLFFDELEEQLFHKLRKLKNREINQVVFLADVNLGTPGGKITKFLFNYDKNAQSFESIFPHATIYRFFESATPECAKEGERYAKKIGLQNVHFSVRGKRPDLLMLAFLPLALDTVQEDVCRNRKEVKEQIRKDIAFFNKNTLINTPQEPQKNVSPLRS